jgi:hypothetical protein
VSLDCGGIKPFSSPAQKPHACILPAAPHSLLDIEKEFQLIFLSNHPLFSAFTITELYRAR